MKKFIALLVSLTLALSMCMFTTVTASAEVKYFESTLFVADDFEGYENGTISALSSSATGVAAAIGGEVVYDETKDSNVLKVKGQRYCVMFAGSATINSAENIVMEFDFMAPSNPVASGNPAGALVSLENVSEEGAAWLANGGDGLRAPYTTSFTGADFIGKWYSAKAYHNVATGNTEWYAGPYGEELIYRGTQTTNITDKSKIGRVDLYNPNEICIDNLKVYAAESDSEARHLIEKAKAAVEAAEIISPAPVTYPETAISDIKNAIESAEDSLTFAQSAEDVALITADFNNSYQEFLASGTDKKSQVEIFDADFSEAGDFAGYQVLFTEGDSIVEKAVVGERDALKIQSVQTNYARFIKDLNALTYNKYVMKTSFRQDEKTAVHQVATVFSGLFNETNTIFEIYSDGTNLNIRYSDNKDGYTTVNTMKSALLVADYSADVWYDIEVSFDMTDRTFMVKVDDTPVLTDRVLWFAGAGSTVNPAIIRAGVFAKPTQQLYVSEFSLVADESAAIVDAYKTVGEAIPVGTGAEYMRELPQTVGNYEVSYESEDFEVVQDKVLGKLLAYPVFGSEDYEGILVAKINVDGIDYRFSYKLPVKAAYTGTVIDHNFNVEAGTKASAIDPAYWTAGGEIASVVELEGIDGGMLSLNGQRTLYSVPEAKRAAGISVVSLKFMAPEDGITDIAGHIISISGQDGKGAIEVCLYDGNICISPGDYFDANQFPGGYATMKAPILTDYEAGKWYDIKVLINFDTRTYKVTVDGKETLTNRVVTIANPIRNIGRISMRASQDKQIFVDDLKIYTTDFEKVVGVEDFEIDQAVTGHAAAVIYPSSFDSEGNMIADDYTFEITGEDTDGITISKTGAFVVEPIAKAGEYTVTATSVYDPSKTVTTKVTVNGTPLGVPEFAFTPVAEITPGMTVTAKAMVGKNVEAIKSNDIAIILVQYDSEGKIVQIKKSETDLSEVAVGVLAPVECSITAVGEDTTNHNVRAFLVYGSVINPITGSIYAINK